MPVLAVFVDGGAGGILIDDGVVLGKRGHQGVDGEVVHGSGVAAGVVVDQGGGVIGDNGVYAVGVVTGFGPGMG